MMRNPSRLAPLAVVAVLALAACGADDGTAADATPAPAAESSDDGLLAPSPIEMSGGGNAAGAAPATASLEAATDDKRVASDMIAPYQVTTFVAGDSLPALPTNDIGYVFQAGATVTAEQVSQLATALGVSGDPVRVDQGGGQAYWRVGPEDGSGPMVSVYEDAQLSWGYNSAWADQTASGAGCAVAGSAGAPSAVAVDANAGVAAPPPDEPQPTDTVITDKPVIDEPVCEAPAPPEGVPTQDEAEARTRDLMVAIGLDPDTYKFETYGDEWFASVNATEQLDGSFAGRTFNAGYGAEGVMQYASGQLAEPVKVGPYPLIDLDAAIARLNDPTFFGGGGGMMTLDTAVATREVAPAEGVDVAEADVAPAAQPNAGTDLTIEPVAGSTPGAVPAPDTGSVSAMPPVSAVPVEVPAPQQVTVTLVDVQPDVWWVWDVDGSAWLLPAYRFIGDDGGWYTVPAVTDDFLVQVPVDTTPPSATEPAPTPETAPPATAATVPADTVTDVTPLDASVGKTLAEFTADAKALGLSTRVVEQDGISLPVTMDFDPTRVNVAVAVDGNVEGDTGTVTAIVNVG